MINDRVLVVDDEEDIRDLMDIHLSSLGWKIDTAATPNDALEMLKTGKYFLMITDLAMPQMDGYELIKKVYQYNPDLPCAVITGFGYDTNHSLVKLNREYDCPVFLKPFDFKENLIGSHISKVWDQLQNSKKENSKD